MSLQWERSITNSTIKIFKEEKKYIYIHNTCKTL